VAEVTGTLETFIKERPALDGKGKKPVTVDDAALFMGRLHNGALASFEATRFAPGRKNQNTVEINGNKGSLWFDLEQLNDLHYYSNDDPPHLRGFHNISVTNGESHPYAANWWFDGHILGWEESHTHMIHDFLQGVGKGTSPHPTFEDGLKVQAVLDAVERSSHSRHWESTRVQRAGA